MIKHLKDSDVKDIPIKECEEELVDMRKHELLVEIDPTLPSMFNIDEASKARKQVVERLASAQNMLPKGLRFKVSEGFRSLEVQKKLYKFVYEEIIKKKHPDWAEDKLENEADKWVTNPWKYAPPHTTGGALDLTIINETGKAIDLGCPINTVDEKAKLASKVISKNAKKNRKLLIKVMTQAGFAPYTEEYWHWSYGDQMWAATYNKKYAFYGSK